VAGNLFFATNVPVDLESGAFVGGSIETQTRQVLSNLEALLKDAGGSLANVAQITFYLIDPKDVSGMNKVYGDFFTVEPYPSRATLIVRELIGNACGGHGASLPEEFLMRPGRRPILRQSQR
jgi:2-iminobutanoate/2-iminopropanoate deaminase